MIIREVPYGNDLIIFYKKNDILYKILYIKESDKYIILDRRKKKRKKKKNQLYRFILPLLVTGILVQNKRGLKLMVENPLVLAHEMTWDYIDDNQKYSYMIEDIMFFLDKNKNWTPEQKKILIEEYKKYFLNYIQYYSDDLYINTLLSTRFAEVEEIEPIYHETEEGVSVVTGYYNKHKISVTDTNESLFHEKLHADQRWEKEKVMNVINEYLYAELFAVYASEQGYNDLQAMLSLIELLVSDADIKKELLNNNKNGIKEKLLEKFQEERETIINLNNLICQIYKKEYIEYISAYQEKIEFMTLYKKLYEIKYNSAIEDDIIVKYYEYAFYNNKTIDKEFLINIIINDNQLKQTEKEEINIMIDKCTSKAQLNEILRLARLQKEVNCYLDENLTRKK